MPSVPASSQRAEGFFFQEQLAPGKVDVDAPLVGVGHPRAPRCLASWRVAAHARGLVEFHPRCLRWGHQKKPRSARRIRCQRSADHGRNRRELLFPSEIPQREIPQRTLGVRGRRTRERPMYAASGGRPNCPDLAAHHPAVVPPGHPHHLWWLGILPKHPAAQWRGVPPWRRRPSSELRGPEQPGDPHTEHWEPVDAREVQAPPTVRNDQSLVCHIPGRIHVAAAKQGSPTTPGWSAGVYSPAVPVKTTRRNQKALFRANHFFTKELFATSVPWTLCSSTRFETSLNFKFTVYILIKPYRKMSPLTSQQSVTERVAGSCCYFPVPLSPLWNLKVKVWASHWLAICRGIRESLETMIGRNGVWSEKYKEKVWRDVVKHFSEIVIAAM